jgi:hypothetical protein
MIPNKEKKKIKRQELSNKLNLLYWEYGFSLLEIQEKLGVSDIWTLSKYKKWTCSISIDRCQKFIDICDKLISDYLEFKNKETII